MKSESRGTRAAWLVLLLALCAFAAGSSPLQPGGTTTRVSVRSGGSQAWCCSISSAISGDGRYIAFSSTTNDMVPNDTNHAADIFVYDRQTLQTVRASLSSQGIESDAGSDYPAISGDGRYVAFSSTATNLVPNHGGAQMDVFVRDLVGNTTTCVSVDSAGTSGNGWSRYSSLSQDGRYIVFESDATNLVAGDTNAVRDIFVHDQQTHTTRRVSVSSSGLQGNKASSFWPRISANGRYVVFSSDATNLVTLDNNQFTDVFLHDLQNAQTSIVSLTYDGKQGNRQSFFASISADGLYVAFQSDSSNFLPDDPDNPNDGDTNNVFDIYVRDRVAGTITRASVGANRVQANAMSERPAISADGAAVAFQSRATNLAGADTNVVNDVFVREWRSDSLTFRISVNSGGSQANNASLLPAISADGRYIAFESEASNLVLNDTNTGSDIFVHDRSTGAVLVQNRAAQPVSGAQVYQNGQLVGTTEADGRLNLYGMAAGDKLAARLLISEVATPRANHDLGSNQNWAYRHYLTSVDIPSAREPAPFAVVDPSATQTLTLQSWNALIGVNLVVSVEWDANTAYLDDLRKGFIQASKYLYDATDGQMLLEQVGIYDNAKNWKRADIRIHASNQQWPQADVGAILQDADKFIYLGRYFDGNGSYQGAWSKVSGFRTQIHEFGHYGLGLQDSYYHYSWNAAKGVWDKIPANCTSANIRVDQADATNATLMDFQYNASELSCQALPALWAASCLQTEQWLVAQQSDWETVATRFADTNNPPRWVLITPDVYGRVVSGPTDIPVAGWSPPAVISNADTGICQTPYLLLVATTAGTAVRDASVTLIKGGGRLIEQGKSDLAGLLVILGAYPGEKLAVRSPAGASATWSVPACTIGQAAAEMLAPRAVILNPDPFQLEVAAQPGTGSNTILFLAKPSVNLMSSPQLVLNQTTSGETASTVMTFNNALGGYLASVALDPNLPKAGIATITATDLSARTVTVYTHYDLVSFNPRQNTTAWSGDGRFEMYVPSGTIAAADRLAIVGGGPPGALPTGNAMASGPYTFNGALPTGNVIASGPYTFNGPDGGSFSGSAVLSMFFVDTGGTLQFINTSQAQIYRWNGTAWTALESRVDLDQNYVSASITDFGTYALIGPLNTFRVYFPLILK